MRRKRKLSEFLESFKAVHSEKYLYIFLYCYTLIRWHAIMILPLLKTQHAMHSVIIVNISGIIKRLFNLLKTD